ncbi:MAG TPA: outer membrane protein assembly factor BamA [Bryobacteraceae bacterium]|nr:outer membrane protein assembly factor BamA [Bryobacteraceae bacterium]
MGSLVRWSAVAALLWIVRLQAQTPASFAGRRVVEVQYSPAQQPLDPVDLARAQAVKTGDPLDLDAVGRAIDQLYATGRYEDIQVEAEPAEGGIIVRFVTVERWFVGHVGAQGKISAPPNRGQISVSTELNLGAPYDPNSLKAAEDNIVRLFRENGLYEAAIRPDTRKDPHGQQINVTFVVTPGKRAKYEMPILQGDPKLPDQTIVAATGWRMRFIHWWREVTQARTRNGINGILSKYQKKDRLEADVQISKMDYDAARRRVKPTLNINAGPTVKIRAIEAKVSGRAMRKYVPIYQERRVDNDLIVEGARNLANYFEAQGYYDVDVKPRPNQLKDDQLLIEYAIAKGERHKLVEVNIEGNKYFDAETIRERMFLEPAGFIRFRHGRYSRSMRAKDEENIANLYKSNGFRDVKVTSTTIDDYKGKKGDMSITFHIDEGPQWFVDNLEIEGMKQIPPSEVQYLLASNAGQPYSAVNIAADRTAILTTYFNRGFPSATFEYSEQASGAPHHVNLKYKITEGDQQFVRDILINGVRRTSPQLIQNHMELHPGDPLSLSAMTNAQKTLYDTGVFAKVDTAIQNPDGNETRKYVLYDIVEAARYTLNLGVGAEIAQIGPTAPNVSTPTPSTGFSPRFSLDISRINMFGRGHLATVRGRVSNIEQMGSVDYVMPRFRDVSGRNVTITALYDFRRDIRTFASKRAEASVQVAQQVSKPTTLLFRLTYRRVSISEVVIPTLLVPQLLQPIRLGMFSINLSQDRRDNSADAHRGMFNTANFDVATKVLGSQRSFVRGLFRNATYHPFQHGQWVLARQTQFGVILPFAAPAGLTNAQSVPLPERFFAGGANSIRAFAWNQAGPRDIGTPAGPGAPATLPTGFPLGGNALLINSLELRFPLIGENIQGVLFEDAGNVYDTLKDISFRARQRNLQDFNYMVHAVGFGVRYRTPIGPVRVDLAYAINPPGFVGFKGTTQELLQCNPNLPPNQLPSFCTPVQQNVGHVQFFFSIGQAF